MRNAIQHERNHIITGPSAKKKGKWHDWAEEEKTIRDCRIRTLQKHNPWGKQEEEEKRKRKGEEQETAELEQTIQDLPKHIQNTKQQTPENCGEKTRRRQTNATNIWGDLGFTKCTPGQKHPDNQDMPNWKCQIGNCAKTSNNTDNLAKHLAKNAQRCN